MATHINAYKDELAAALKEAQGAVDKVRQCYEKLLTKLDEQPTTGVPAPVTSAPDEATPNVTPPVTDSATVTQGSTTTNIPVQPNEPAEQSDADKEAAEKAKASGISAEGAK